MSSMLYKADKLFALASIIFPAVLTMVFHGLSGQVRATQSNAEDVKSISIYISDFELFSSAVSKPAPRASQKTPNPKKAEDLIYADTDSASVQARLVIDSFANTLIERFHKAGYSARRLSGTPPANGVLLRGVFAEPDGMNRIRRAILGAGAPGPTFTLYVAAFNLAHQDQPLYLPAPVQSPDSHYGPVITLNAYVPMVKFDIPKDPAAEEVRKICVQIVSQLSSLLAANPHAIPK